MVTQLVTQVVTHMVARTLTKTRYPYLFTRRRVFYFRVTLPARDGRRQDLCMSLRTSDLDAAKMLAAKLESAMAKLLTENPNTSNPKVIAMLRKLAKDWFESYMADINRAVKMAGAEQRDWMVDVIAQKAHEMHQTLQIDPSSAVDAMGVEKLLDKHITPDRGSEVGEKMAWMLARAMLEGARITKARLEGRYEEVRVKDETFQGADIEVMRPFLGDLKKTSEGKLAVEWPRYRPGSNAMAMEEAIQRFLAAKKAQDLDGKTVRDIELSLRIFRLINPDVETIADISKASIVEFATKLADIPRRFTNNPKLAKLSMDELVKKTQKNPKLGAGTRDKHNINLRQFVEWLQDQDAIESFKLPKHVMLDKEDPKVKRHPFTDAELVALFQSPMFTGHMPDLPSQQRRHTPGGVVSRDAYYWVPLVALYSGMREGEILQLEPADIKTEEGVRYFNVTDEGNIPNKSLKNESSRRRVPIHEKLLELGFMDYVADVAKGKPARLFAQIAPTAAGSYTDNHSKKFSRYLTAIEIKHPKLTFHSLRHTFLDYAEKHAQLKESLTKSLSGHSDKSMGTGTYGSKYTLKQLREGINKIQYPHQVTKALKPYLSQ